MTSKLIEGLNKCDTTKSYEGVRYTLIDDELRSYIEESLKRLEILEQVATQDCIAGEQVGLQIVNNLIERGNTYKQETKKLKKSIQNFIEWIEKQLEQIEQIVNLNKGTYTNIVELSVLNDILDKLKEVLGE